MRRRQRGVVEVVLRRLELAERRGVRVLGGCHTLRRRVAALFGTGGKGVLLLVPGPVGLYLRLVERVLQSSGVELGKHLAGLHLLAQLYINLCYAAARVEVR